MLPNDIIITRMLGDRGHLHVSGIRPPFPGTGSTKEESKNLQSKNRKMVLFFQVFFIMLGRNAEEKDTPFTAVSSMTRHIF
jgi:hypothetical protein